MDLPRLCGAADEHTGACRREKSFYFRRSRFQDAVGLWTQALQRSPDNPRGLFSLGAAYIRLEKFQDAVAVLERSIVLRPTLEAYSNLGFAYWRMGEFEKAVPMFQQAFQLGQDYRVAGNLARALYFTAGRRAEAVEMDKRGIQLAQEQLAVNPGDPDVHALLARYHAMLGQRQPALQHLQSALNWSPDDWHYLEYANHSKRVLSSSYKNKNDSVSQHFYKFEIHGKDLLGNELKLDPCIICDK